MAVNVRDIKGIGEKTENCLKKLHIETVDDLIHHYPRCYVTYPKPISISEVVKGQRCSIKALVSSPVHLRSFGKRKLCTCLIADSTGQLFVRWFNMPYLNKTLHQDEEYIFTGTPVFKDGRLMLEQPEFVLPGKYKEKMTTYQPVYPLTAGLNNTALRKAQKEAFKIYKTDDYLPEEVREYYQLQKEETALYEIHFPTQEKSLLEAKRRIIFDEFFRFFSAMELVKEKEHHSLNHYIIPFGRKEKDLIAALPYDLTNAQRDTIQDIFNDFSGTMAMNRLVQGDVGSGKTIVAVIAMYAVCNHGYQAAMMAPTEVLARQHYDSIVTTLAEYGVSVGLLIGSMSQGEKKRVKNAVSQGEIDILIGTHAMIQDSVHFYNLALVVTDEQHRFGVKQRDAFRKKGKDPHVLVMSATPIPRTLGMILYRDLDISIMNELPASRLPIKNCVVGQSYRQTAWNFIMKELSAGHQAYIICPMIEESDTMDLENVTEYEKTIQGQLPPAFLAKALHGKMSAEEKNTLMVQFAKNQIQILISTTVIEVGIDVPNATVMLIENAERFGLAQLHQLRGRVGRGKAQSYCIFMSGSKEQEAMDRLSIIGHSNDGFEIANEDLRQRGPGEFFGTSQSGIMSFALGDIYANADILKEASEAVDYLKNTDYNFMKVHPYSLESDLEFAKNL